jgi:phosphopantothenoylcysteine decarboxylase/phosphopantothenate--cysteine ligase
MLPIQPLLEITDCVHPLLRGKKILVGITGSVAAYKALPLIRLLRKAGAEVRVIVTRSGLKFVTRNAIEALSNTPVYTSAWMRNDATPSRAKKAKREPIDADTANSTPSPVSATGSIHIDLARWADAMVIAPATANFMARVASGLASDLLSTELLAFRGPVLIAPAMNPSMFSHPATQANLSRLREFGYRVLQPEAGLTACGETGVGRLPDPESLLIEIGSCFRPKSVSSHPRVGITLGATQSPLDPVRYITNHSSGLMGAALAWAAWQSGREVTLLKGVIDPRVPLPPCNKVFEVTTASEMAHAAKEVWPDHLDLWIAAAAVLDWDVANPMTHKIKKEAKTEPELRWKLNPDILAYVGKSKRPGQKILGFAAETDWAIEKARAKLLAKNCDGLFCNLVGQPAGSDRPSAFGSTENEGYWLTSKDSAKEATQVPRLPKLHLAQKLIEWTLS